jgi:DNA-binding Xre family transcriptional regulator
MRHVRILDAGLAPHLTASQSSEYTNLNSQFAYHSIDRYLRTVISVTTLEVHPLSEKTPDKAQRMIHDLLLVGVSGQKISKNTGISEMTISAIKNGRNKRVSEAVFDKIWEYYDEQAPPREEMDKIREEGASKATGPRVKAAPKAKQTPKATSKLKPKVNAESPKAQLAGVSDTPIDFTGMINRQYIPVNVPLLSQRIDELITRFQHAVSELEQIKSQIG